MQSAMQSSTYRMRCRYKCTQCIYPLAMPLTMPSNRTNQIESWTVNWPIENICLFSHGSARSNRIHSKKCFEIQFDSNGILEFLMNAYVLHINASIYILLEAFCYDIQISAIYSQTHAICQPNELHKKEKKNGMDTKKLSDEIHYSEFRKRWEISQSKSKFIEHIDHVQEITQSKQMSSQCEQKVEKKQQLETPTWKLEWNSVDLMQVKSILRRKISKQKNLHFIWKHCEFPELFHLNLYNWVW